MIIFDTLIIVAVLRRKVLFVLLFYCAATARHVLCNDSSRQCVSLISSMYVLRINDLDTHVFRTFIRAEKRNNLFAKPHFSVFYFVHLSEKSGEWKGVNVSASAFYT